MSNRTSPLQVAKSGCNRRQFITGALTGAGVLMAGPTWLQAAETGRSAR